jgi:hypothetical protein
MTPWLRRVRGVVGMGLIWAVGGFCVGGLLELIDNIAPGALPFIRNVDMWPQTLAIPGFLAGVTFGIVLSLAGRRRRFEEWSIPRFAAWGAAAGAILGGYAVTMGAPLIAIGVTALGSTIAASGSLFLARRAAQRALVSDGAHDAELSDGAERKRLENRD